jgi:hypothetical protein
MLFLFSKFFPAVASVGDASSGLRISLIELWRKIVETICVRMPLFMYPVNYGGKIANRAAIVMHHGHSCSVIVYRRRYLSYYNQ